MAHPRENDNFGIVDDDTIQISSFEIRGLFGNFDHRIDFPKLKSGSATPEMIILEGQNGTGKTTMMEMIAGIVGGLNFDTFRKVPFIDAKLTLSNGKSVDLIRTEDSQFPLKARFEECEAELHRERGSDDYSTAQLNSIEKFRESALPYLKNIDFELLTTQRTFDALQESHDENERYYIDSKNHLTRRNVRSSKILADKVSKFLREAQLNHRKFFETSHLSLLPRIMSRLSSPLQEQDKDSLLLRIDNLFEKERRISELGLYTDHTELMSLREFMVTQTSLSPEALHVLETYIQLSESQLDRLAPLASRIEAFGQIMDEFLVGKRVRVSPRHGLHIQAGSGQLHETSLSSGEYHFLYMMVSALLCQRTGTVLAIDEPELSLHVTWQRKLVSALTRCASGASPIFFFSTHSTAISASHAYAVQRLSILE